MKIYLSHNFAAKEWLKENVVPLLEKKGHTVTSRWLNIQNPPPDNKNYLAETDYNDIQKCHVMIHFSEQFGYVMGRGKYVEIGAAACMNRPVMVVGCKESWDLVFYYTERVKRYETLEECLAEL